MLIPSDTLYITLTFCPSSEYKVVCKEWNDEIKYIQKQAVYVIEKLYIPNIKFMITVNDFLRHAIRHFSYEFFLVIPEVIVDKFDLNPELLTVIPFLGRRKRSNVRDWIMNMPIELNDWLTMI
jgi:hypothetical protein